MGIRLTIVSDLFGEEEIIARDHLPIHRLLAEIKREYNLVDEQYSLRFRDSDQPLNPDQTLEQAGVRTGMALVFEIGQGESGKSPSNPIRQRAFLQSETGETFNIVRQPALIGRPDTKKQIMANMLDADLTALDPTKSSSRPHAQITQRDGVYYLESLRDDNLAYVNGVPVRVGNSHPLRAGDKLRFGAVTLEFRFKET
jgi:hypothetical protein